ncbi:MAG: hypothetical protein ABIP96_00700 [Patescibacteria group bacterium]
MERLYPPFDKEAFLAVVANESRRVVDTSKRTLMRHAQPPARDEDLPLPARPAIGPNRRLSALADALEERCYRKVRSLPMGQAQLPEKDEEFEAFLRNATVDKAERDQLLGVARRVFYGAHFPRLFPIVAPPDARVAVPRRLATMPIELDMIAKGEWLAEKFGFENPQRLRLYWL